MSTRISYNHLAIFVLVVAQQLLGALWYSPLLFAEIWAKAQGKTVADLNQGFALPFIYSIIASFLFTYFAAMLVGGLKLDTARKGAVFGLSMGIMVIIPLLAIHYSFLQLSDNLWWIDGVFSALMSVLVFATLSVWKPKES